MSKKPDPPSPTLKDRIAKVSQRAATRETQVGADSLEQAPSGRAPRTPVFRNATLAFGDGERMTVAVKDLNDQGARIEFFKHTALPDRVLLVEPTLNLRRTARVVWQRELIAGLEFVEA